MSQLRDARLEVKHLPESLKFKDRERSVEQKEAEELEDFIRLVREVMQQELQERFFDKKISNSRLANDVVKLSTRQMSPGQQKKQKLSGTSRMFRGASVLEPQESEMTEPTEFDTVTDEIRRWSSLSEDECQRFVCAEDGVLNEIEMMWHLRILFPLHFFVFKKTASHLTAETNVEQVFSRTGQLSEVNSDPDDLTAMVSIIIKTRVQTLRQRYHDYTVCHLLKVVPRYS